MKRRGYTLFEMIVVVALICLLAGLATPPILSMYDDYRLQAAVDEVAGRWSAIRARAITEGRPYRFSIQSGSGDFRVGPDASEFWSGGDSPAATGAGNQAPLVAQDSLPKGIQFVLGDAGDSSSADARCERRRRERRRRPSDSGSGGWSTVAVFLPDGTAQQDADIRLQTKESGPVVIHLRGLTGEVSTRWISANQNR